MYLALGFERSCRVKRLAHLRRRNDSMYVFSTAAVNLDVYFVSTIQPKRIYRNPTIYSPGATLLLV